MNKYIRNGILLVACIGLPILAHQYFQSRSPLYNFFFSPDDLYNNLSESDFDLSKQDLSESLSFKIKYPGSHWVSIIVENPPKLMEGYASDFEVKISIFENEKLISEFIVNDDYLWFYGGKGRSGFALKTYKAPSDLPINTSLVVRVQVVKSDPIFSDKYGKQRLIFTKISDE